MTSYNQYTLPEFTAVDMMGVQNDVRTHELCRRPVNVGRVLGHLATVPVKSGRQDAPYSRVVKRYSDTQCCLAGQMTNC